MEVFKTANELYRAAYQEHGSMGDAGLKFIKRHLRTTLKGRVGEAAIEAILDYGIRKILWDMEKETRKGFKRPGTPAEQGADNTPRGGRGRPTEGFEYSRILDMVLEGRRFGEFTREDCTAYCAKYKVDASEKAKLAELMEWGAGKLKGRPKETMLSDVASDAVAEKARARIFDD